MKDDPTISRIRTARHEISKRFKHDPRKIVEYYMELQKRDQNRLLSLSEPKDDKMKCKAADVS
jgi:hypothetical protein